MRQSERRPDWNNLEALFCDAPEAKNRALDLAYFLAEERAAIMEYCGGLSREEAEAYAFRHTPRPNRG